jgi:hypothetical protein
MPKTGNWIFQYFPENHRFLIKGNFEYFENKMKVNYFIKENFHEMNSKIIYLPKNNYY